MAKLKDYCWIITLDNVTPGGTRKGLTGGRGVGRKEEKLARETGEEFRMLDDDGEVYYKGRLWINPDALEGELEFRPLDDLGSPDAGCSEIQYKNKLGAWETL